MGKYGGQAYEDGVGFSNEKYFVKSFYKDNKLEKKKIKLLDDSFFDKNSSKLIKDIRKLLNQTAKEFFDCLVWYALCNVYYSEPYLILSCSYYNNTTINSKRKTKKN